MRLVELKLTRGLGVVLASVFHSLWKASGRTNWESCTQEGVRNRLLLFEPCARPAYFPRVGWDM